jgi:hypothetical protein
MPEEPMEATYNIAGIDVYKKMLAVVIANARQTELEFECRRFGTTVSEIRALSAWLKEREVREAAMESTAQYSRPVWLGLEEECRLHLAQARSNRGPRGRNKDPVDALRGARQPCELRQRANRGSNADQSPAFALVPAVSYSASPVGYLVNAYDPGKNTASQLTIWSVDGTNLSAPVLGSQTLPVAAFSVPPNAEQVGTDVQVNTAEITNVVLPQPNALWVAQESRGFCWGSRSEME